MKIYFLTVLEAKKYKMKALVDLVSVEGISQFVDGLLLIVSHMVRSGERSKLSCLLLKQH